MVAMTAELVRLRARDRKVAAVARWWERTDTSARDRLPAVLVAALNALVREYEEER